MYQDPKQYQFNDADLQQYGTRFWQMPVRLADDGLLRELWKPSQFSNGGGAATSLLPLLAIHAYPTRRHDDAQRDGVVIPAADGWTTPTYLSQRRMAPISGIGRDTASRGLKHLVTLGLAQVFDSGRLRGLPKQYYRLNHSLFPRGDESYADISGHLLYGGIWAMLPISSARHLYLVAAAVQRDGEPSIAKLERLSGLGHHTIHEAIKVLTKDTGTNSEMLVPKKFTPNKLALESYWKPEWLNDAEQMLRIRRDHWPEYYARLDREGKVRAARKRKRRAA